MINRSSGANEPLMSFSLFDQLPDVSYSPSPTSKRMTYIKQGLCIAGTLANVGIRCANINRWTNAISSLGIGFTAMAALCVDKNAPQMARIRQVALPLIGQVAVFSLSQAWANDVNRLDQESFDNAITALLGANLQIIVGWLLQLGAIRSETISIRQCQNSCDRKLITPGYLSMNCTHLLKIIAGTAFGVGSFLSKDSILQPVSAYFFSFFYGQVLGERCIEKIDHEIEKRDQGEGTVVRKFKTILLTISYVGQILSFVMIPWRSVSQATKILDMRISGAIIGTFDGILDRSSTRKAEKLTVAELDELKKLPPPDQLPDGRWGWKYTTYRIWKVAVPALSLLGVIAFTGWQTQFVLEEIEPKIALSSMMTGFCVSTAFCYFVDTKWKEDQKKMFMDYLMASVWFSPRIWGIDPLFLYYAIINAVKIDNQAIEDQKSPHRLAALFFAWLYYGARMGHEEFISLSDRVGNAQTKLCKMAIINAMMSTVLYLQGEN